MLNEKEINDILRKYDKRITEFVKFKLPLKSNRPFVFCEDDIIQEVKIQLWKLIKERYKKSIGEIKPFIFGHLPNTIQGVIFHANNSLKYTGKEDIVNNKKRRNQSKKVQKNSYYLESLNRNDLLSLVINFNDSIEFQDFELDWETINLEMKKQLKERSYKIFDLFFNDDLKQMEIAQLLDKDPGTISRQLNINIFPILKKVLKDFGYIN